MEFSGAIGVVSLYPKGGGARKHRPVGGRVQLDAQNSGAPRRPELEALRPAERSASRMRWRSSSDTGVSGGRTWAAGMRPRMASASFMRLCMSTKGGA